MKKLYKVSTLLITLILILNCFAFAVSEEGVFVSDSPIDETILNDNTNINPDTIVDDTITINDILDSIKSEPTNEDSYKKIGELYVQNNDTGYKVFSEGSLIDFSKYDNVKPTIIEDRTMIPLRAMAESLGAKVDWNSTISLITITLDDKVINLTLNSKNADVNGKGQVLDVPASSIDGRTMVPLRFVGEAFGKKVGWYPNGEVKIISIAD